VLIEGLLERLLALPAPAVYLVIGTLATVENIIPLVPADTAVALGAFLAQRGLTTPLNVFLVTWVANTAGAVAVYVSTRTYGRSILSGRVGRRLLSPSAIAAIEREYIRFGVVGIFITRFLPGIRAVVPAFAGLVKLSAPRALIPLAVASGIWYGALTAAAAFLGANWETVIGMVSGANAVLGVVGLERAFQEFGTDPMVMADPALRAAAALVLDLASADSTLGEEDRHLVETHLTERWDLSSPGIERATEAELEKGAERIKETYSLEERLGVLERMHRAAIRDTGLSRHETWMISRAAALLGVTDTQLATLAKRWRAEDPAE
jgi:membrane protein DedA with SNARE-associated domain